MSELVADCPRCGAKSITFDLVAQTGALEVHHGWQHWYEAFCLCRHCRRATIFHLCDAGIDEGKLIRAKGGLTKITDAVNYLIRIAGFVSLKDAAGIEPPEHTPKEIATVFSEGATCFATRCFNAAGTMFRLCVDLTTRALLPDADSDGLNAKVRRDLGLRLPWLFEHGRLLCRRLLGLLGRPVSAYGRLCRGEGGHEGGHRCRRALMLTILRAGRGSLIRY